MKTMSKMTVALVGAAGLALAAESAQAVTTLVANGAGSSAGRQFTGLAPALLCDTAPVPLYFQSTEVPPNKTEWQCNVSGAPVIIRYSATGSADGYLTQPNGASATAVYLNVATCPAGTNTPNFKGTGRTVSVSTCPGTTPTQNLTVHWGGADVKATSLHQKIFNVPITPPASGHLTATPTVIVPFSSVLGANVRDGNGALLKTLSDWELRQIFTGTVKNWTDLGYSVSAGSAAIVSCHRSVGSGTLATLDETIMHPGFWGGSFPNAPSATIINGGSSSGLATCVDTHLNSIGYIDSDSVTAATFPSGAYQVAINGHEINLGPGNGIGTGKARLTDLRCGRYIYWADWNFVTRNAGVETAPINAPAGTDNLITALQASMVANNPLPDYWLSEDDTFVFKNVDRGPMNWFTPTNNGDNIAAVCKSGASTH